MINSGVINQVDLYDKLWDRMNQTMSTLTLSKCNQFINLTFRYHRLNPSLYEQNCKRMQTFIGRYIALLRNDKREDSSAEILKTMQSVKAFVDATNTNETTIQIDTLYMECAKRLFDRPEKLKP